MTDNRTFLHHGQVSKRNIEAGTAKVAMDDAQGLVSADMQVLFPAAGGWNWYWTPKEGDHVVMDRLPNGTSEGHIVGKVYTAKKMPQGFAPDIMLGVSDDGKNLMRFDAKNGTMDITFDQKGTVKFKDLDIHSVEPIGFEGGKLQLGSDILRPFWTNLMNAFGRNPVWIPPAKWPKYVPVPPVPVIMNMAIFGFLQDGIAACVTAITDSKLVLK